MQGVSTQPVQTEVPFSFSSLRATSITRYSRHIKHPYYVVISSALPKTGRAVVIRYQLREYGGQDIDFKTQI